MPRCTRSIVLVLIGVALPACDGRQQRDADPPVEPDGSFGGGPSTNPSGNPSDYPAEPGGDYASERYGPTYHTTQTGVGWTGGTTYNNHYGGQWTPGGFRAASSDAEGHSFGASHAFSGSHVSFGGFGSHASGGGS